MLRLPPFEYRAARTVAEAVDLWAAAEGRAMYVAGGTDLLPNMKRRQFEPPVLVGIRRIDEMRQIELRPDGGIVLGAGLTLRQLADDARVRKHCSGLAEAAGQVANLQIQRMGTLGGNLCVDTRCNYYNQTYEWRRAIGFCLKKDGDICLVAPGSSKCWAVSSTDTAPLLMALGATVDLVGPGGARSLALARLYQDDGIDYLTREAGEIVTAVHLPPVAAELRSTYLKVRRRGSFDFPILGVGAALSMVDGAVHDARLVLGAVHTHPVAVPEAAEILEGRKPDAALLAEVAEAAYKRATPLDNVDLMYYWRKQVTRVNVCRALARLTGLDETT